MFKPFVQYLNILSSNGISVSTNGIYKGSSLAFLADTEGGFKKSVSAYRCVEHAWPLVTCFQPSLTLQFQLRRTTNRHKHQCDKLVGPLREHYSKVYGVNDRSILLDIKG